MIRRAVRSACAATLVALLCGAPALGQNNNDGKVYTLSPDKPSNGFYGKSTRNPMPAEQAVDAGWRKFVRDAVQDNLAEIKLGQLAQENASSDTVKKFAQKMIEDHTKANAELTKLASSKGVQVPTQPSAKQMALYNRLKNLHGVAFDKAYAKAMVDDHKKAVSMFEARANSGRNTDLRMWVASTVPTLRHHLEMAKEMAASVSGATVPAVR